MLLIVDDRPSNTLEDPGWMPNMDALIGKPFEAEYCHNTVGKIPLYFSRVHRRWFHPKWVRPAALNDITIHLTAVEDIHEEDLQAEVDG